MKTQAQSEEHQQSGFSVSEVSMEFDKPAAN